MINFKLLKTPAFLTIYLCFSMAHAKENCKATLNKDAKAIQKVLVASKEEHYKDWDKKTTFFFWGRLSKVFEATDPESVEKLFSEVIKNPDDLTTLYFASQSGEIKLDWNTAHLIEDLYHFMEQQEAKKEPLAFWQTPNRHFNIMQALRKDDGERNFENTPEVAAAHTRVAMDRATMSMLARALAEHKGVKFKNRKTLDWLRRWFSPHHGRALKLLETLEDWHRSLSFIYRGDEPMYDALAKYKDVLSPEESQIIKAQIEATSGQYEGTRKGIAKLFGREVGTVHEITRDEVRLWDMEERQARAEKIGGDLETRELEVEAELDHLDDALASNFSRRHLADNKVPEKRPMPEYHDTHLRIRHKQYSRETPILTKNYYQTCSRNPKEANYDVSASWTYTVSYMRTVMKKRVVTDEKGNQKEEEYPDTEFDSDTYTHSPEDFTLLSTYNEVLNGEIVSKESEVEDQLPPPPLTPKIGWITTGSSNDSGSVNILSRDEDRIEWILSKGKKARDLEKPRREQIDAAIDDVEKIIDGYPKNIQGKDEKQKHEAILAQLDKLRAELKTSQEKILQEYHQLSSAEITSRWENDKIKDFQDRNSALNHRYLHQIKRIEHLREQIRRKQDPLILTYNDLPNYDPQIKELDDIRRRIRIQQGILGGVIGVLGGTGLYYNEEVEDWLEDQGILEDNDYPYNEETLRKRSERYRTDLNVERDYPTPRVKY